MWNVLALTQTEETPCDIASAYVILSHVQGNTSRYSHIRSVIQQCLQWATPPGRNVPHTCELSAFHLCAPQWVTVSFSMLLQSHNGIASCVDSAVYSQPDVSHTVDTTLTRDILHWVSEYVVTKGPCLSRSFNWSSSEIIYGGMSSYWMRCRVMNSQGLG